MLREDLAASLGPTRFLREIEIAAQLQHPHILPLLDSGDRDGFLFYVMPYVTGQSLRERIGREGELPLHEAVRLLIEVVDALAHAHAHGVVHRDIKPDNVMLSGRHALVADFGVAKAVSEATGANSVTTLGVAVGTPTYMSPEQAAADPHIDHRSDIYAIGVMAYELLAGRPPFTGATPQQVLAAHVTEEPDPVSKRRPGVSPALEQVVMKCLAKRPADRWQTADELLAQLEPLSTPSGGITPAQMRPTTAVASRRMRGMMIAAAVLLVIATATIVGLVLSRRGPSFTLGQATRITSEAGLEIIPSLSPDGKFVAYLAGTSARMRIFVRPIAGGRTITLTDDTTAVQNEPRWSPDGATILFRAGGGVAVAPALGGPSRPVIPMDAAHPVRTATWSPDGNEIAFVRGDSLLVRGLGEGPSRLVTTGRELHSCDWSPTTRLIACVSGNSDYLRIGSGFGNIAVSSIVVVAAAGGPLRSVSDSTHINQSPVWSPDGKALFYVSDRQGARDIYRQSVSSGGAPSGDPMRLTTGLNAMTIGLDRGGDRLTYALYTATANIWAIPYPIHPPVSAVGATAVTSGTQVIEGFRFSPDGKSLLYDSNINGNADIFRLPLSGGEPEGLTTDSADEFQPDLSPDGTAVTYHAIEGGRRRVMVAPLNGGPKEVVSPDGPPDQRVARWSPDGKSLAYYSRLRNEVFIARRGPDGKWLPATHLTDGVRWPTWSPDGKEIVGASDDGRLIVTPSGGGASGTVYAPRTGTSDPIAESPEYDRDGKSLTFKSHDQAGRASLWSIPAVGGTPRLLVHWDDLNQPSYRVEWASDGKRVLFAINDRQSDVWVVELIRK